METNTIELKFVEQAADQAGTEILEISDVQLAFVGGGIADPVFA